MSHAGYKVTQIARSHFIRPDVYPLIAAVSVVLGFGIYRGSQELLQNPETSLAPTKRMTASENGKITVAEGDKWHARTMTYLRHKDSDVGHLSAFEVFSPTWWKQRAEVHADPYGMTRAGSAKMA